MRTCFTRPKCSRGQAHYPSPCLTGLGLHLDKLFHMSLDPQLSRVSYLGSSGHLTVCTVCVPVLLNPTAADLQLH